jgi:hypothetical protein
MGSEGLFTVVPEFALFLRYLHYLLCKTVEPYLLITNKQKKTILYNFGNFLKNIVCTSLSDLSVAILGL